MNSPNPALSHLAVPIPGDLCSIAEAAQICRVAPDTIYRWIRARRISAWGGTNRMRVSIAEVMPCYSQKNVELYANRPKRGPRPQLRVGAQGEVKP